VVKGMNSDKVFEHDGFSMVFFFFFFFQTFWDVIKLDIMGVFHDFHACISLKKVLDATIIAGLLILRVFYGFFSSFLGCNQVRHYGVFYDFHACISLKKSSQCHHHCWAIDLKDFWHISLVGGVYKIIAKALPIE
jgi:hypothetical protein